MQLKTTIGACSVLFLASCLRPVDKAADEAPSEIDDIMNDDGGTSLDVSPRDITFKGDPQCHVEISTKNQPFKLNSSLCTPTEPRFWGYRQHECTVTWDMPSGYSAADFLELKTTQTSNFVDYFNTNSYKTETAKIVAIDKDGGRHELLKVPDNPVDGRYQISTKLPTQVSIKKLELILAVKCGCFDPLGCGRLESGSWTLDSLMLINPPSK
ncbi:MAG: hypothetical protein U1A78_17710 [Polyangia bacterium]